MAHEIAYKKLEAWRVAMDFVEQCCRSTRSVPLDERYGLIGQLRRAAVSIPSNAAEGYGRGTTRSYAHHVSIALGSHAEIETYLDIATRPGYLDTPASGALTSSLQTLALDYRHRRCR
jgi:four helix bundle protein